MSTRKCLPAILRLLASGVGPTGTCVNIEVIRERLIRTLNDIQLHKSGGSFGVNSGGWTGRS